MINFLRGLFGSSDNDRPVSSNPEKDSDAFVSPSLPPNRRLYCIGDIHGRLDLLEELHGLISEDAAGFKGSKAVIYLGDYIDRGAQSCQVLELLVEQPLADFESVCLLGNHEQAMLNFLEHPRGAGAWLTFGGRVTLRSYGVGPGKLMVAQDLIVLRDEFEARLPPSHLDFLESCRLAYTEGSYCFVHAGIRPDVTLADQSTEDLLWIREDFTRSPVCHEHIIVHGHSISDEVEWLPNRIGIDTGAYHSGLLTALVLEGPDQRLLQTGRGG